MNNTTDFSEAFYGLAWLLGGENGLNITALHKLLESYTPEEKYELYRALGVGSYEELLKMYVSDYEEQFMQYAWYRRSKILLYYIPPILLIIGTIGNCLSFLVLMRRSMRKVSAYNYLAVLSITDLMVLYVGLFRLWVGEITGYDIKDHSDIACKLINVIGFTVSDYSVWLLIAVTVERYIVTVHALKATSMCTRSRARKVIVGILVLLFIINSHFFVTTEITYLKSNYSTKLVPECNGNTLASVIWPWVDAIIYSFLPFLVIIILNTKTMRQVARSLRTRSHLVESQRSSHIALNNIGSRHSHNSSVVVESAARITVILLVISFVFLLTTLPMNITMIVAAVHRKVNEKTDMGTATRFHFARTVTELLMYTNHSINFFLYLVAGHKFRQQLSIMTLTLFCRRPTVRSRGSVYSEVEKTQNTEMNGLRDKQFN